MTKYLISLPEKHFRKQNVCGYYLISYWGLQFWEETITGNIAFKHWQHFFVKFKYLGVLKELKTDNHNSQVGCYVQSLVQVSNNTWKPCGKKNRFFYLPSTSLN